MGKSNVPIQFIISEKTLDENLFGLKKDQVRTYNDEDSQIKETT